MALPPVVRVAETRPRERGIQIGQQSVDRIRGSIDLYTEVFAHYAGLTWADVVRHARQFREPIGEFDSTILEEMDGVAQGAELDPDEILALNVRSEVMFGLKVAPEGECTSFFAGPHATADGHTLIGQNWDWKPECTETVVLLDLDQGPDLPSVVTVVEAGLVAKTGFNSAGLGMATNTLITPMDKGQPGVPYHILLRRILNSWSLEEALASVAGAIRSASAHYLMADRRGRGLSLETTAGGAEGVFITHPDNDTLGHSNNFTCVVGFQDLGIQEIPDSPDRVAELSTYLSKMAGRLDEPGIVSVLSSHDVGFPNAICRHPDTSLVRIERLATDAALICDLTTATMRVTAGRPCENVMETYVPSFAGRPAEQ